MSECCDTLAARPQLLIPSEPTRHESVKHRKRLPMPAAHRRGEGTLDRSPQQDSRPEGFADNRPIAPIVLLVLAPTPMKRIPLALYRGAPAKAECWSG